MANVDFHHHLQLFFLENPSTTWRCYAFSKSKNRKDLRDIPSTCATLILKHRSKSHPWWTSSGWWHCSTQLLVSAKRISDFSTKKHTHTPHLLKSNIWKMLQGNPMLETKGTFLNAGNGSENEKQVTVNTWKCFSSKVGICSCRIPLFHIVSIFSSFELLRGDTFGAYNIPQNLKNMIHGPLFFSKVHNQLWSTLLNFHSGLSTHDTNPNHRPPSIAKVGGIWAPPRGKKPPVLGDWYISSMGRLLVVWRFEYVWFYVDIWNIHRRVHIPVCGCIIFLQQSHLQAHCVQPPARAPEWLYVQ